MRTSMFSGFKNRFWKLATATEVWKFMLYLTVPIGASAIYADHEVMKKLILKLNFIEYPKASSTPVKQPEVATEKQN